MLARREHSRQELRDKLLGKGHAEPEIEAALAGLAAEGLLDDRRFVEAFVRSRVGRGEGPARIEAELRRRGIDAGLIADGLEAPAADWVAQVREVRRKRFGADLPSEFKERARQARFLQQRGFTMEQIRAVLAGIDLD